MMFVMAEPEIPATSLRVERAESPVTVQVLVASRLRAAESIAPESVVPFRRTAVIG